MATGAIRRLLIEGAARPSRGVDVGEILRKGRLQRRKRVTFVSVLGVAVVVLVAIAAANLDSVFSREGKSSQPIGPAPIGSGWTKLPPPPEVRDGSSIVWAGSRLITWGGCDLAAEDFCEPQAGGFGFDPITRQWSRLEDAPVAATDAHAVWTGAEAVFIFSDHGMNGQAYDPETGSWRTIAQAPIQWRPGAITVWTGSEIIVWGGGDSEDGTVTGGAAYDPVDDAWRTLPEPPLELNLASGMWTGREMIVFGSLVDDRNRASTKTSVGAAYNPVTDTWRELPPSDLSPQATSAVWVAGRMVAWDYEVHSQEYDAARDVWTTPVKMPLDFSECYPDSTVARDLVFGFFCGRVALYDPGPGTWEEIHGGILDEKVGSKATGGPSEWRFAQLASTGDAVFLLAEGITVDDAGEVCYGCPGSPVSFWAYRPPG
jgi:hypothetical protein